MIADADPPGAFEFPTPPPDTKARVLTILGVLAVIACTWLLGEPLLGLAIGIVGGGVLWVVVAQAPSEANYLPGAAPVPRLTVDADGISYQRRTARWTEIREVDLTCPEPNLHTLEITLSDGRCWRIEVWLHISHGMDPEELLHSIGRFRL